MADLAQQQATSPSVGGVALFEAAPAPMLVLAPDTPRFTITDVNQAYRSAVMRTRETLIGLGVFEAMPDNPADLGATGVANLRASLERAIATKLPDKMPVQRYDIPHPAGGFEERWWDAINAPVLGADGKVISVVHYVVDVTEWGFADVVGKGIDEKHERPKH